MFNSEDQWPLPNYTSGPTKHVHALGEITTCASAGLLRFLNSITTSRPRNFFSIKCQMSRGLLRSGILRNITKKDPQIAELIEYAMLHFARCYENRNILMHSKQYFGVELDFFLSLEKKPKGKEPLTFHLNLSTLRKVADDIMSGVFFITDIWRSRFSQEPASEATSSTTLIARYSATRYSGSD